MSNMSLPAGKEGQAMPEADGDDRLELQRFVQARPASVEAVPAEWCACRKHSHWSCHVLPQLHGLATRPLSVLHFGEQGSCSSMGNRMHAR